MESLSAEHLEDSQHDAPHVSIIIVSWNALPLLKQFLPSVVQTHYNNLEIILADNASTDGSEEWVADEFPQVRIVRHPENWAFCRGNNEAIRHATGKYIALLNNDVEVPEDWLHPLIQALESDPRIAAVQPKLLQAKSREWFEYAGAAGGFIDRNGYPFARGRIFSTLERDLGQYDHPCDIFWATGAAVVFRKQALDEVGLLDENFFMHMEEIDLCWRLWRHGYRIRVIPESKVYHVGGGSLSQGNPQKTYFNFRNNLITLYKNLPPGTWRKVFFVRMLLDSTATLRAFLLGNFSEARAIIQAYLDAHRMKARYKDVRPTGDSNFVFPCYRGSIVFDYFLLKRHRFSDLPSSLFTGQDCL